MDRSVILSYLLILGGVLIGGVLLPGRKKISHRFIDYMSVFGGAFLFASCFINLVPHIFLEGFETPTHHFKVGAAVLLGFIIQLVLEHMTHGVEHGHNHCAHCSSEQHHHPIMGLMIGLCVHAFLEGMPLVGHGDEIHQGLLYGIVLHNLPITVVMVGLFIGNGYSTMKSLLLLFLFGIMTPLGSIFNTYCMPHDHVLQSIVMGAVVGILLHVSVSILFDHEQNRFSWMKFALIVVAFVAAYYTPGCPEIYAH